MDLIIVGPIDFRDRAAVVAPANQQHPTNPDKKRDFSSDHSIVIAPPEPSAHSVEN